MLHYSDTYVGGHQDHLSRSVGQEWDVVLDLESPEAVEPRFLHAVVSSWFDLGRQAGGGEQGPRWRPGLAPSSGHDDASKTFAMGPIWLRPDGRAGFSLRVLGGTLDLPTEPQQIRLGRQKVVIDWRASSMLREQRIADLLALPSVASVLVRFETPVTRRRRHTYHPVPSEQSILASWERSAAAVGLDGATDWSRVSAHVIHLNGHTARWAAPKGRGRRFEPVGFVGDVGIAVPVTHGRRLHQLATLASFAGTGSHATFGMGFTTLMATEVQNP